MQTEILLIPVIIVGIGVLGFFGVFLSFYVLRSLFDSESHAPGQDVGI